MAFKWREDHQSRRPQPGCRPGAKNESDPQSAWCSASQTEEEHQEENERPPKQRTETQRSSEEMEEDCSRSKLPRGNTLQCETSRFDSHFIFLWSLSGLVALRITSPSSLLQYESRCTVHNSTLILCPTPAVGSEAKGARVKVHFLLDSLHFDFSTVGGETFSYEPNPKLFALNTNDPNKPYHHKPGSIISVEVSFVSCLFFCMKPLKLFGPVILLQNISTQA